MITAERTGHTITRNSSFFKKVATEADSVDNEELSSDELDSEMENVTPIDGQDNQNVSTNLGSRRSSRVTAAPFRFPMDVRY